MATRLSLARTPEPRGSARTRHQASEAGPPTILAGHALDLLPSLIDRVPKDTPLCLYHTFTITFTSREPREKLLSLLSQSYSPSPSPLRISRTGRRLGSRRMTFVAKEPLGRNMAATVVVAEPLVLGCRVTSFVNTWPGFLAFQGRPCR